MRAISLRDFRSGQLGWARGDSFVVWRRSPVLFGAAAWGVLERDQAVIMTRALSDSARAHRGRKMDLLVDGKRLSGVGNGTIEALIALAQENAALNAEVLHRLMAITRPTDNSAALLGVVPLGDFRPALVLVEDLAKAAALVGEPLGDIEAIIDEAAGTPAVLAALQAYLERALREATLEGAAAHLHVTSRSLQRRLKQANRSFREELARARISVARRLLSDGDASLKAIAHEVGFSSVSHLASAFRRLTGATPTSYRDKLRGG